MWTTKKKNLIIIGGGSLQHQTLVECNNLGLGKILVDGDPNCYCARSPLFNQDYFIHANVKDKKLVLSKVKEFLRKRRDIKPVGVYTQGQDFAVTVAYVAKRLGLPSIGDDVAIRTNDKGLMRQCFEIAGIPQPKFRGVGSFPLVVKSVDNCASRGLTIVKDIMGLGEAVRLARENSSNKKDYIIEEFIDGVEYSVDTVVYKGIVYPGGISDRVFLPKEQYAIQDGSITPSFLPEETQQRMYWIMQDCADALGVKWGALKGDLIVKDNKIYVLEVTARLSGGFDSQFRKPYSFGINLIKATIDLACGKPLDFLDLIPKWNKFSQTFTVFPKPGIIKEIRGEEELKRIPGVRQYFITKKVGDKVDYKHCADRVIHIIASGDTYDGLQETVKKAKETIRFITE